MSSVLLLVFSLVLARDIGQSRTSDDDDGDVDNVKFEKLSDRIYLHYDLSGPDSKKYDVTVILRRTSDASFEYRPVDLRGEVGTEIAPGREKLIIWDVTEETAGNLSGDDYYFVVNAVPSETSGSSSLVWIGAGTVVVSGVIAYLLLQSHPQPAKNITKDYPEPPGRP